MTDPKIPDIPLKRDEAGNYPEDYSNAGAKQDPAPADTSFLDTPPPELPPIPDNSDI